MRYVINPPDLPSHCYGCGSAFSICDTLDCKKGGLVTDCHNELRDKVADLAGKAFIPAYVREDPNIFTSRTVQEGKSKAKGKGKEAPSPEKGNGKGYILIRDLWTQGKDSIHDMRVVNTDAISYQSKTPENFLETVNRKNKKKYFHACLNKRRRFNPSVASVDGHPRVEAEATLK